MTGDPGGARHEPYMRRAVELSRTCMRDGAGGPFGAVVVVDGEIVGEGWNEVTSSNDPTAHAEIVAVRHACERLDTYALEGAVLYASCQPCPMCLSAIYWARITKVYYANTTEEAEAIGFDDAFLYRELTLPAEQRAVPVERMTFPDAHAVFDEWAGNPDKLEY